MSSSEASTLLGKAAGSCQTWSNPGLTPSTNAAAARRTREATNALTHVTRQLCSDLPDVLDSLPRAVTLLPTDDVKLYSRWHGPSARDTSGASASFEATGEGVKQQQRLPRAATGEHSAAPRQTGRTESLQRLLEQYRVNSFRFFVKAAPSDGPG